MLHLLPQEFTARRGRVHLHLRVIPVGEDVCVVLDGGDRPHIGVVSVAAAPSAPLLPTPPPLHTPPTETDGAAVGASSPVVRSLPLPAHREEELAAPLAARLQAHWGCTVAVLCGVHLDAITPQEIRTVFALTEELTQQLLAARPLQEPPYA